MEHLTLLVVGDPHNPVMRMMERLEGVSVHISNDAAELEKLAPDADILLNTLFAGALFRTAFPKATKLRWAHTLATGVDGFIFPELKASPVPLTNARGAFKRSLGEYVVTAMLYFAKDLRRLLRQQAANVWEPFEVEELNGKTLGIIGYGEIGRAAAERARPFGMRILALRRRPEISAADPLVDGVYGPSQLNELIAQCDYLMLSTPHTPDTDGMIGVQQLALLKANAVLINVGRGAVIDEAALIEILEEKRIRGAALDVFQKEPLAPGHPFYRLENVLLSPHCADRHEGWLALSMEIFLRNFAKFQNGQALENIVDKHAGY